MLIDQNGVLQKSNTLSKCFTLPKHLVIWTKINQIKQKLIKLNKKNDIHNIIGSATQLVGRGS